jgi:hypothetical protein
VDGHQPLKNSFAAESKEYFGVWRLAKHHLTSGYY